MPFKRIILAAGLAITLSGCPWFDTGQSLTPAQTVHGLQLQLDAALAEIEVYADQLACTNTVVVGCYEPTVLISATELADQIDGILDDARLAVEMQEQPDTVAFYADRARALLARLAVELTAGKE